MNQTELTALGGRFQQTRLSFAFFVGPRGGVTFDKFWKTPNKARHRKSHKDCSEVWFAEPLEDVDGISRLGPLEAWKKALLEWSRPEEIAEMDRPHIELGEFEKYMHQ